MHKAFRDGFEKTAWEWGRPEAFKASLARARTIGAKLTPRRIQEEARMNIRQGKRIEDLASHPEYINEKKQEFLKSKKLKELTPSWTPEYVPGVQHSEMTII